jgi:hypothetical protein
MPGDFMEKRATIDEREIFTYECPDCGAITGFYHELPEVPCCAYCHLTKIMGLKENINVKGCDNSNFGNNLYGSRLSTPK